MLSVRKDSSCLEDLFGSPLIIFDVHVHFRLFIRLQTAYSVIWHFMKRHYNVKEIDDKLYLFIENPRIRTCQKYLTIFEEDKLSIEDLYFLYDLNFTICKGKCYLILSNNEKIEVDRKTGIILFPSNVIIKKDNVVINNVTRNIIELILRKYQLNKLEEIIVDFDINEKFYYEVFMDDLLHVSKEFNEVRNDSNYIQKLIERGYDKVVPNELKYNMNEESFSYAYGILKLK